MIGFTQEELTQFHNNISNKVKELRTEKKINQLDLALELGFKNSSFISHAENPNMETHHYSLEHLYKIAKVMDVDIKEFF